MFGQTFSPQDIPVIGLLVVLEGLLSIDNALVLGLLARRLPQRLRTPALTYGLAGAFIFRFLAIGTASFLLRWRFVKLLGGGYLVWVSIKHFFLEHETATVQHGPALDSPQTAVDASSHRNKAQFWHTVVMIELTDIAFAVDSILAAIALVGSAPAGHQGPHPKLWVVITGGMVGVILMRFAAVMFIRLLERFPRFEAAAYLLVLVIGAKLLLDWGFNTPAHPNVLNFHDPDTPVFWVFWSAMAACFCAGFLPRRHNSDR